MRPIVRIGVLAATGLVFGICTAVAVSTASTAASGQMCMGVVVDDGSGGAPSPQAAQVPPGTTDLQALGVAGDSATQNNSGLVCAINGYPTNGLQNCTAVSGGQYDYWSYWQGDPYSNTWTYAPIGPASHAVGAGETYVEGWRFQNPGPDNASAPKPGITPATAFAAACPGVPPVPSTGAAGGGGGATGPGATGSGSGGAGSSTASPSVPGAAPATPATPGAATSPASAVAVPGRGSTGSGGGTTVTSSPGGVGAARAPGTTGNGNGGTGNGGTTTTASTGGHGTTHHAGAAALASSTPHGGSGGSPILPLLLVAAAIVVIGGVTLFRWRRRPAEE
jgi:hypothetical protein